MPCALACFAVLVFASSDSCISLFLCRGSRKLLRIGIKSSSAVRVLVLCTVLVTSLVYRSCGLLFGLLYPFGVGVAWELGGVFISTLGFELTSERDHGTGGRYNIACLAAGGICLRFYSDSGGRGGGSGGGLGGGRGGGVGVVEGAGVMLFRLIVWSS